MTRSVCGYIYFVMLWIISLIQAQAIAFELVFVNASLQIYAQPHNIVLSPDQRYLYVADNNNNRIAVLDPTSLKLIGSFGKDEVAAPHDLAFDSVGRLLVADTNNSRIAIYETIGAKARLVGEQKGVIRRPEGVAVHPNGRVYATGSSSNNIASFENGVVVVQTGGFDSPHDIVIAPDGTLWIADAGNDRLVNMSQDLKLIKIIKGAPYFFKGPRYLEFDNAGRLYVADKYNHQIKVLAPDMSLLLILGGKDSGLGRGKFDRPEGVAIHGADVWFSDTYNDRIVRYRIVE